MQCFPPMLNQFYGLQDIRGYDGVDPRWVVELLQGTEELVERTPASPLPHAATMFHVVPLESPIHDLLGVRYLLFHGMPSWGTAILQGTSRNDYSIVERPQALTRCFVPHRIVVMKYDRETLDLMRRQDFRPAEVAFVNEQVPIAGIDMRGSARIIKSECEEVVVAADMETPGLLVLADMWYPGWNAYVDGKELSVLRTDYALRGVVLPPGHSDVVFRYEPESFARGVKLAVGGAMALIAWCLICYYRQSGAKHGRSKYTPDAAREPSIVAP